jgi:UDP:flavonoid glycosyltransferase YjiC (YdhE family)
MDSCSHVNGPGTRKPRLLFVAEPVSLAHVVRLSTLARTLDRARYDIIFASASFPQLVFAGSGITQRRFDSTSSEHIARRVERGRRPWNEQLLAACVEEDLRLLEEVQPDLVVGDFRLSLAVSAPLSRTPYASLINAYWSPYAQRGAFPMPEHPLIRLLGEKRVAPRYVLALPFIFRHFARPINRLRRRYGLPELGGLLETLTFGDHTLYPDVPELAPTRDLPANHHYLGTVPWSPRLALPAFWNQMDHSRPLVYVTLGSSGSLRALAAVLDAARELPVTMLVATAGRFAPDALPKNVWVTDFVPGDRVARQAALVISNGGSTTGYQALEQGTPVLGLPFNFDQYLSAEAITSTGAGLYLRSGAATAATIRHAVERLLHEARFRAQARRLRDSIERWDARRNFRAFVERTTASTPTRRVPPSEQRAEAGSIDVAASPQGRADQVHLPSM